MIKTEFIEGFDFSKHIPAHAKTGLIGCSDCASVFRTADTKTMESVRKKLSDSFDLVFCVSLDSPCDQRMLRHAVKGIPGFSTADYIVVLACEAGSRSLGTLLSKTGRNVMIVSPLRTTGYRVIQKDNTHKVPCIFCETCHFPEKNTFCPVADCPINRTDGPCQNRKDNHCIFQIEKICSWLGRGSQNTAFSESEEGKSDVLHPAEGEGNIKQSPCLLLPAFKTIDELQDFSEILKKLILQNKQGTPLFFLQGSSESLDASAQLIYLVNSVVSADEMLSHALCGESSHSKAVEMLGLAFDYSRCSHSSISSAVNTASALGISFFLLKEPSGNISEPAAGSTLLRISSLQVIEQILDIDSDFNVCTMNMSACQADIDLAEKQQQIGAGPIFTEISVIESASADNPDILYSDNGTLYNLEKLNNPEIASIVKSIK